MLRYLGLSTLCDATFVLFLGSWLVSRQIGLAWLLYTSYVNAPKYIPFQWDAPNGLYLTYNTYLGFCGMQVFLYVLATMWFYLACMVAVRVVQGKGAEDSRSDDEDDGIDEELEQVSSLHEQSGASTGLETNGHGLSNGNGYAHKRH